MAIKAVLFDTRDPRGEVDSLEHLVPYRPSPETLLSSIKALGLRLLDNTDHPDHPAVEQGNPRIPSAAPAEHAHAHGRTPGAARAGVPGGGAR